MGCGRVGSTLARSVEKRGHSVAVIDSNVDAFRRLGPSFSGDKITGIGFDQAVLEAANIKEAAAFAAVSSGDNSNIISARVARETFGIDNVVARIYDPGRAEVYQRLGIPTVATVKWTSDQVLRRLMPEGTEPEWRDASGRIEMQVMEAPVKWIGRPVDSLQQTGARVAFLTRLGEGLVPTRETAFQDGDVRHVVLTHDDRAAGEAAIAAGPEDHR